MKSLSIVITFTFSIEIVQLVAVTKHIPTTDDSFKCLSFVCFQDFTVNGIDSSERSTHPYGSLFESLKMKNVQREEE
jgi:hypothetical protein